MDMLGVIFKASNSPNWMVVAARELIILSKQDPIKASNELDFFYKAAKERIFLALRDQQRAWDQG